MSNCSIELLVLPSLGSRGSVPTVQTARCLIRTIAEAQTEGV